MMEAMRLPSRRTMVRAFLDEDASYDGVFYTGVRTTGIFCRPVCRARKPRPENVTFFASSREAILAGFRPCKKCRPLEAVGTPPAWLRGLLEAVEEDPSRRWRDRDLRNLGLTPDRVRRWFQAHYGMTFHAYSRARRLGTAIGQIQLGDKVIEAAYDSGYDSLSGFNEALRRLTGTSPTETGTSRVITVNRVPTPLGPMLAGATEDALCLLEFVDRRMLETQLRRLGRQVGGPFVPGTNAVLKTVTMELAAYFDRRLTRFSVPLLVPGTPFQEAVWTALLRIPFGETRSYGELAAAIGQPRAVRAVGKANGDNRVAVIIPCHRVIGADGKLTGYGGGLWRKQRLLDLEEAAAGRLLPLPV
jgi:AraC family transcriptional regulator of adaptative response/methylated-DNA-[protein]-cysteine methyltransferase